MAIQSAFYFTDGTTRTFPSTKHIASSANVAVWMKRVVDDVWELTSYELWTLVNNSIVFTVAPQSTVYSQIELRIADESDELIESPSNIALVAGSIANVDTVATNISAVNTVSTNITAVQNTSANATNIDTVATNIANVNTVAPDITKVNTVATNITNVNSVATTIVPNIAEILLADDNAIIATTKANEASDSATSAQLDAWIAEAESMTAEAYATTPLNTFVSEYTSNGDGTFTATPTSKYSALHWAATVDDANFVHKTGDETVAGIKTFSSSPIVPTPTTDFQAATKKYVDISALPIGAILNGYTIFDNCIVAFGGEFNRADYPKLWEYLQVNPSLLKTQEEWTTENNTNGMCGYFSSGNGTATFRVPNLDKAFLRPDSRTIGSFQGDAIRNIVANWGSLLIRSITGNDQTGAAEISPLSTQNVAGTSINAKTSLSFNASLVVPTANENRPKNISVLPLIVAK